VSGAVPARLTFATLGARDVPALAAFYRRLGWPAIVDTGDFACFDLRGALLGLFALASLAADARSEVVRPERGLRGFTLAINVETRDEVDSTIAAVREAGGRITKEPVDSDLFEGRSSYFADPEDNFWEVVWLGGEGIVADAVRRAMGLDR
jgi:catechol 2,3-dioxygenase-like lactoylglutathione lyase family enzyme